MCLISSSLMLSFLMYLIMALNISSSRSIGKLISKALSKIFTNSFGSPRLGEAFVIKNKGLVSPSKIAEPGHSP